jgi:predicted transcriptional regulator
MTTRIASRQVDATDLKHDILNALVRQKGSMSPEQIASATSAELQTIIDALQEMTKRGFVKMSSNGKYFAI